MKLYYAIKLQTVLYDFAEFVIRIGRRDRPKSFLPCLNGKKAVFRPSDRLPEIRRFGSSRPIP